MRGLFLELGGRFDFPRHVPGHTEQTAEMAVLVVQQACAHLNMDDPLIRSERAIAIGDSILTLLARLTQRFTERHLIVRMDALGEFLEDVVLVLQLQPANGILDPQEAVLAQIDLPRTDSRGLLRNVEPVEQEALLLGLSQQQLVGLYFVGHVRGRAEQSHRASLGVAHDTHVRLHVTHEPVRPDQTVTVGVTRIAVAHGLAGHRAHFGQIVRMHEFEQRLTIVLERQLGEAVGANPVFRPDEAARAWVDFPGREAGRLDRNIESIEHELHPLIGREIRFMRCSAAYPQPMQARANQESRRSTDRGQDHGEVPHRPARAALLESRPRFM